MVMDVFCVTLCKYDLRKFVASAGALYEQSSWLSDGAPHMSQEFLGLFPLLDEASSQ